MVNKPGDTAAELITYMSKRLLEVAEMNTVLDHFGRGKCLDCNTYLDCDAVLLSLNAQYKEEWTADGRSDSCRAGVPVFGGVHPITRGKVSKI